jgi:hypothetical protein
VREQEKFAKMYDLKDKMVAENKNILNHNNTKKLKQVAQYISNKEIENEKQIMEMPRRHIESGDVIPNGLLSPKRSRLPQIVPNFPQKEADHATLYNQSPKAIDNRVTTRR